MAGNKKFFDLPLRTGVTADDRLAIVDSGNTTTYSVKVSDLQDGTGVSTLNTLTGGLTLAAGTNMTITDNGTDTITFDASGGGSGNLVAATGTTSYKTANITDDADIQGDYSIYIGNNFYSTDRITSTSGKNLLVGNGEITTGANNAVFGASSQDAKIADSSLAGNVVIQQGRINAVGLRGCAIIQADQGDINSGQGSIMMGGYFNNMSGDFNLMSSCNAYSDINGSYNASISNGNQCDINGSGNIMVGIRAGTNIIGNDNAKIAGYNGNITGNNSGTFVGSGNTITHDRSVILGGSGLSSNYDDEVQVPNLTIANYASLNYADDTAAAAGGILLGQVYHNAGALRIRIT